MEIIKYEERRAGIIVLNKDGGVADSNNMSGSFARIAAAIGEPIEVVPHKDTKNFKCKICGVTHTDTKGYYINQIGLICEEKYNEMYKEKHCSICGSKKIMVGGTTIFEGCGCGKRGITDKVASCSNCGTKVELSKPTTLRSGKVICDKCTSERRLAHNDTRVYVLPQDNQRRYGVELEISGGGDSSSNIKALTSLIPSIAVGDGSVSNGMEVVVDPFTLDQHINEVKYKEFFAIAKTLGYKSHSSCGMHIHTGINSFKSTKHLATTMAIANTLVDSLYDITKRKPNSYCKATCKNATVDDIIDRIFTGRSETYDKYNVLNINNIFTIEFRLPAGATSYSHVIKNIALYDSMIDVALEYEDSDGLNMRKIAEKLNDTFIKKITGVDFSNINPFKNKKYVLSQKSDGEFVFGSDSLDDLAKYSGISKYNRVKMDVIKSLYEKNSEFLDDETRNAVSRIMSESYDVVWVSDNNIVATLDEAAEDCGFKIVIQEV